WRGHFQRIRHRRIVVYKIGHASRFSWIKPQLLSFRWSQIQGQQRIELPRILDGRDRSRTEYPARLVDACPVVRLDAVQIELYDASRCQLPSYDRCLNCLDRRFLDLEFCALS